MPLGELFQLADHLAARTKFDPRGEEVLEETHPDLLQPPALGIQPVAVTDIDQHLPSEQGKALGGQRHRGRCITGPSRCRRRGG
jgi:hypothetical protein